MNAENTSFASAIQETAKSLDLAPTAAHLAAIEAILQGSLLSYDDDGRVTLDLGDGPLIATDAITVELKRFQLPTASTPSPAPQTSPTERSGVLRVGNGVQYGRFDPFASLVRGFQAAENAKIIRETETWPNPWKDQINRTRQAIITNKNPALAAKYRAEAGL